MQKVYTRQELNRIFPGKMPYFMEVILSESIENDDSKCSKSIEWLCMNLGVSRSTLGNYARKLEKLGLIKRTFKICPKTKQVMGRLIEPLFMIRETKKEVTPLDEDVKEVFFNKFKRAPKKREEKALYELEQTHGPDLLELAIERVKYSKNKIQLPINYIKSVIKNLVEKRVASTRTVSRNQFINAHGEVVDMDQDQIEMFSGHGLFYDMDLNFGGAV